MMRPTSFVVDCNQSRKVGSIVEKPLHSATKTLEVEDSVFIKYLDSDQREQADERSSLQRNRAAIDFQLIVIKPVFFVPEPVAAKCIHGFANCHEMLEKLRSHIFIHGARLSELQRYCEHG